MSNYQGGLITNRAIEPQKPVWLKRITVEGAFALCDKDLFNDDEIKKDNQ